VLTFIKNLSKISKKPRIYRRSDADSSKAASLTNHSDRLLISHHVMVGHGGVLSALGRVNQNNMNLKPLGDNIVVKGLSKEETTKSGIILPETVDKEKPEQGEVLAVGPGKYQNGQLVPMEVKVGSKVLFKKYGPDEFEIEGEKVLVISQDDVVGVLE